MAKQNQRARAGVTMVGLFTYGKAQGMDWHEYLQGTLTNPLIPGKEYYFEIWVKRKKESQVATNNIGIAFVDEAIEQTTPKPLHLTPDINSADVIVSADQRWHRIWGTFVAQSSARYLIIGNFFADSKTLKKYPNGPKPTQGDIIPQGQKRAYYFVDNVFLVPAENARPDEMGTILDIHFDHDKYEIRPQDFSELQGLRDSLLAHPNFDLELFGHTDSTGNKPHNQLLSTNRANAVKNHLVSQGIAADRIRTSGFGATRPVASNTNDTGRALNRRVEFRFLDRNQLPNEAEE